MHILLTGGHPAPALAFIDFVLGSTRAKDVRLSFVGRKYNNNREFTESYEYKEITSRNIPFYHLAAGRLTRVFSPRSIQNMLQVPYGFLEARRIVRAVQPDRVLSFGGYLGLPVAVAAYRHGTPVFVHEQTMAPGIATRIIGRFARKVFVSFPDNGVFDRQKTVQTGNLLRDAIFETNQLPFSIPDDAPLIYVTGGSLGSHSVNILVEAVLRDLLEKFTVVHQIGNVQEFDDFSRLSRLRDTLLPRQKERYIPVEHIPGSAVGSVFRKAALVVSRSGANTVSELIALQKPSVLIPLPWAARNEQRLQAEMMERAGVAVKFEQDRSPDEFFTAVLQAFQNKERMARSFSTLSSLYNPNATRIVLDAVVEG